jgi:hypothetical protein
MKNSRIKKTLAQILARQRIARSAFEKSINLSPCFGEKARVFRDTTVAM